MTTRYITLRDKQGNVIERRPCRGHEIKIFDQLRAKLREYLDRGEWPGPKRIWPIESGGNDYY